jgi:trigger factor
MKDFPMQREWFVDQAKRRVSLGLILSEIVKVQQAAGASRIRSRRSLRNRRRATSIRKKLIRWYYAQPQRLH